MIFPEEKPASPADFMKSYFDQILKCSTSIDPEKLAEAVNIINNGYKANATLFSCGNGGSAAISNHLHCDHLKGCQTNTSLRPKVISLSSNMETITAIANDISFNDVFLYQLRTMAEPGDILITISSSGDSENIVRACNWAKENSVYIISLTGFDGGRSAKIADISLHVNAKNYGIIEDIHQSLMHILAQYIRLNNMNPGLIADTLF